MRLGSHRVAALLVPALLGCPAPPKALKDGAPPPSKRGPVVGGHCPNFAKISATLRPSVVSVVSARSEPRRYGMASGIVVGPQKRVLTNAHVLQDADEVYVELASQAHLPAKILAQDPRVDLALLEIQPQRPAQLEPLVPVQWRDTPVSPGQWAICMGHPYGLGHTVTVGVVSGTGRDYGDMGRPPGLDPQGWWSMLQIDAAINVGNSGGPVVDRDGQVLGIATATRRDGQGLAFAIPAPMARHFVQEIEQNGQLRAARLGARVQQVGPSLGSDRLQNLQVVSIVPDSPSDKAGLRVGDLLLRVGDRDLLRLSTLIYEVQRRGIGSVLPLEVRSPKDPAAPTRRVELHLDAPPSP